MGNYCNLCCYVVWDSFWFSDWLDESTGKEAKKKTEKKYINNMIRDILHGAHLAPRVTMIMIEDELDMIEGEIEPRILTFENPISINCEAVGAMAFDAELDAIDVNLPTTMNNINIILSYFPEVDWRAFLRRMVNHELAHKNQGEYLSKQGVSIERQGESHYRYLMEFQAHHAVPCPFWRQSYLQELQKLTVVEMGEMLKDPDVWASSIAVFSEEDIREVFGPYGVAEAMLKLKDIADKVRTKEDILRYAPETKKLLYSLNKSSVELESYEKKVKKCGKLS